MQRVERDQQADRAGHSGNDRAGAVELEQQAVGAEHQQDIGDVGIGDHRQQPGLPVGLVRHDLEIRGCERPHVAVHVDLAAVDRYEQRVDVTRHHVDDVLGERVIRRQAGRLAHRLFGPLRVAAAHLREPADVGDGVLQRLV